MTTFSEFMRRHYSFRWFSDAWSAKQKWLYVALYVILFKISLIPILIFTERIGLLVEGSSWSLATLVLVLLLWFAIYQPAFNLLMATVRRRRPADHDR